jgi:hypothetical protein
MTRDMLFCAIAVVLVGPSCAPTPTPPPATTTTHVSWVNQETIQNTVPTWTWCGNTYTPPPGMTDCTQVLAWFDSTVKNPVHAQNNPPWRGNSCACQPPQISGYAGPATCVVWGHNAGWIIKQLGTCTQ